MKQKYRIISQSRLENEQVQVLTNLYLPLIGMEALTLYLTLLGTLGTDSELHEHTALIDQMNLSAPKFLQARSKLEGYGLIKTFAQELTTTVQWVYMIFSPLSAANFLNDRLLVQLLRSYLGAETFDRLSDTMLIKPPEVTGKDVSKGFFDVVNEENFSSDFKMKPIEQQPTGFELAKDINRPQIDIDLLTNLLQSFGVSRTELKKYESELMLMQQLYNLDDMMLARIIQAHVTSNQTIDIAGMTRQLAVDFQQKQMTNETAHSIEAVETSEPQKAKPSTNNRLIDQANQMSPLEFLADIREQMGGIVTASEQHAIEQLMRYDKLPKSVINMELYVLAVKEKRTSLSKALLEATYTDWAQAKLKSPIDVIKYIQQRDKNQRHQRTTGSTRQRQVPVRETTPDWAHQPTVEISQSEQVDLNRMLANMAAKRKEKEGK
ncbi:DnaD domain protein [Weissella diestrammenae]|uniref:DnaD domain protein n=2 Tax=Weissella diestrammenae TaxID=1162633 RepID=A0A7G9T4W4_9LACO|nr:DnaD domain protein [Weissella diestrammenae]QNN75139.1 DnaD domain protein [Weissella diestrammenae]